MRGTHRISLQNKRIRYDFEIKRNITVIRGDSATGKTALVDMIREHYENGTASAVELTCDKECTVLEGRTWAGQLSMMKDSIVFIDEGNEFVLSDDFASAIRNTDNYYVIVTREGIPSLPYSVEEIYGIRDSGKYGTLKRTYNEFYHLYPTIDNRHAVRPENVIAEDSNAGYQFLQDVCEKNGGMTCISAHGKSNIFSAVIRHLSEKVLVVADGAAFGSEMEKLMRVIKNYPNVTLYLPESFEWKLLNNGMFANDETIRELIEHPERMVDTSQVSTERYCANLLADRTANTPAQYSKSKLNECYIKPCCCKGTKCEFFTRDKKQK